ncbi:hypothetical protein [Silvibacterium dinghuense]|uniref:Holin-X, holin superfamily III n=1 Tax=Silvibacterium dinghuense TaxID=1560006 RepID=A0A4Q1S8V5_9BACT|nr:hypothetical protein [Silvibacterium dinghuense]RXS93440.1 hypothetical protein ESZ00_19050 [Silvibacterium dinghuense]GGH05807.1 hypothetical protein GCM10011586_22540 [Silvibacterium dinghuense]
MSERPTASSSFDPQLIRALAGLDADASMLAVQRTRRAVMVAANERRMARVQAQKQLGMVLLAIGGLLIFLTPAIWLMADDLFEGEHFQDPPTLAVSMVVTFLTAIFAALIVTWRKRESLGGEPRGGEKY